MTTIRSFPFLAALALAWPALAAPPQAAAPAAASATVGLEGTVLRVIDGDTLEMQPKAAGSAPIQVRLAEVDAPEICQEGGVEAQRYLGELVLKQPVRLVLPGGRLAKDAQGLVHGTLWVADVQVNRRMVEEGWAWSVRVKWDRGPYVPQERMAIALSRGVHRAGAKAIPPWDFRKRHGPCPA